MTLTQAAFGADTFTKKLALVLGGSLFIALAAQVSVPFFPVPMTLQTLAILIVGLSFGARLGAVTLLAYLAEGAAGLSVFANGGAGFAYMMGPTGGFLLGFVAMAYVAGLAAGRGMVTMLVASFAAAALIYLPGLAWPAAMLGKTMPELLSGWMLPFLAGDALKAVLAVMAVAGGMKLLAK
ncbi:biotin transport system substrate-specific component [Litoreibacter ponti]|uniref:Biotin transporter n=1 Tax=Litoreibacter ponti TaxID=1510457 RepID=A0A2T6BHS8_9RHOB|nr:biotin transporter BioY [Litoreibacter ponti]PTX55609.1 biotin transport system substrate-specific component [Litoreibacter ponti]